MAVRSSSSLETSVHPDGPEVKLFGGFGQSNPFILCCSKGMLGTKCRRQTTVSSIHMQGGRKSRRPWWLLQRRLLSSRPATLALCRGGKSSDWSWRGSWPPRWPAARPCFPPTAERHWPGWLKSRCRADHDTWMGCRLRRNRGGRTQTWRNTCIGCYPAGQVSSGATMWQSQRLWSQQNHLALHPVQSRHQVAWQLLHLPNPAGSQSEPANMQHDGAHWDCWEWRPCPLPCWQLTERLLHFYVQTPWSGVLWPDHSERACWYTGRNLRPQNNSS